MYIGVPPPIETEDEDAPPPNLLPYLVDLYDAHRPNEAGNDASLSTLLLFLNLNINCLGQLPVAEFWTMIIDEVFKHVFTAYDVARLKVTI